MVLVTLAGNGQIKMCWRFATTYRDMWDGEFFPPTLYHEPKRLEWPHVMRALGSLGYGELDSGVHTRAWV